MEEGSINQYNVLPGLPGTPKDGWDRFDDFYGGVDDAYPPSSGTPGLS